MPTGYTSAIYNGKEVTLKDYILTCARTFGPLYNLRDKPFNEPWTIEDIQKQYPIDYFEEQLEEAEKELVQLLQISKEEFIEADYQKKLEEYTSMLSRNNALKLKYETMLEQVNKWNPTEEYKELKKFMTEQLKDFIKYDISEPEKPIYDIFAYKNKLENLRWTVDYYKDEVKKIKERSEKNIKWASKLLELVKDL